MVSKSSPAVNNLLKVGLVTGAASASLLASLIGEPARAETPAAQAAPAQTLVAQSTIVEEAVVYEQGTGFYATLGLGAQWPQNWGYDTTISNSRRPDGLDNFSGDVGLGGGFSGDIGIGYDFGAIRAELTYGYSNSSVNDISASTNLGDFSVDTDGSINKNDILVSAYWDIDTGSRWTPYVGGGIGWTNIGTPSVDIANDGRGAFGGGNRSAFGYQAKLGVAYGVNNSTDVYVEGVYQGATSLSDTDDVKFDAFNSWGAKLGVRFRFGGTQEVAVVEEVQPAPAPAPAPQPAPYTPEPAPAPIRGLW
ncbi:MAG: outer membrane beta-barrel protein [Cyanobacteriota bacterium]|nr:outer membrane beta-barrel protein [Cyanobacteriota bacterium]